MVKSGCRFYEHISGDASMNRTMVGAYPNVWMYKAHETEQVHQVFPLGRQQMAHTTILTHMSAISSRCKPRRPPEYSFFGLYVNMRRVMHQPSSGFATHSGKPVHNNNACQKARQMGISLRTSSVRRIYRESARETFTPTLLAYRRLDGLELSSPFFHTPRSRRSAY